MELDSLKKVWKEQQTASFSREEILAMLKKKSSSVAKWIFYISLAEFAFWILLSFIIPESKLELNKSTQNFIEILTIINYIVIISFIVAFFSNYRKIKVEQNIKQLLKNIFKIRKTVQYYIIYNLAMIVISIILSTLWIMAYNADILNIPAEMKDNSIFWGGFILSLLIFILIILTVLFFFYRLLYGFLLRRLKKNYSEIKQLQ